jgi:anion-transporting  ArsA/GET3 family ATPase
MRDGDPHKSVQIREMFRRFVDALDAIETVLRDLSADDAETFRASKALKALGEEVADLRDIMSKADD